MAGAGAGADLYLFKLDDTQYILSNVTRNNTCGEIKTMLSNEEDFDLNSENYDFVFGGKKWDQDNETLQEFIDRGHNHNDPRNNVDTRREDAIDCMKIFPRPQGGGYVKKKKSKKRQIKGRKKKRKTKRRKKRSKKKRSGTKRRR